MEWDLTDLGIKVSDIVTPTDRIRDTYIRSIFAGVRRYSSNSMPIFLGWDLNHMAGQGLHSGFKPGASLVP